MNWYVTVEVNGKKIVGIGPTELSGKENMSEEEEEAIRQAAENLLSFIGKRPKMADNPQLGESMFRCPKCKSAMIHTRLRGYRCNLGCQ